MGFDDAIRLPAASYRSALTSRSGPGVKGVMFSVTGPAPVAKVRTSISSVVPMTPEPLTFAPETVSDEAAANVLP